MKIEPEPRHLLQDLLQLLHEVGRCRPPLGPACHMSLSAAGVAAMSDTTAARARLVAPCRVIAHRRRGRRRGAAEASHPPEQQRRPWDRESSCNLPKLDGLKRGSKLSLHWGPAVNTDWNCDETRPWGEAGRGNARN